MAWSTPSNRSTGDLITASIWNQDAVSNPVALRAGAVAIASQATADFIYASSSTQLARLAASTGRVPYYTGAAWQMRAIFRYVCEIIYSSTQTITAGNTTALTMDTEVADGDAMHTGSNSTIVVPEAGYWLAYGQGYVQGASGSVMRLHLRKNGTGQISARHDVASNNLFTTLSVLKLVSCAASDTIELAGEAVTANCTFGSTTGHEASRLLVVGPVSP